MKAVAYEKEMEVETSKFPVRVGDYGVFEGKIWRAVSSSGQGKEYRLTLEREFSGEKITLHGMTVQLQSLKSITSPTGYIKL